MELLTEVREGIATLTINRPEQRNALSTSVMDGLIDAIRQYGSDPATNAIIITGMGEKAFWLESTHDSGRPLIAAVNGAALGGGFSIMLACDLAIAASLATQAEELARSVAGLSPATIRLGREAVYPARGCCPPRSGSTSSWGCWGASPRRQPTWCIRCSPCRRVPSGR